MQTLNKFGITIPNILLPKNLDTKTWATVACDQYTQDRNYWADVEKITNGTPSTLNLILPEVYLEDNDRPLRMQKIRKSMSDYLENGIFAPEKKEFIYIERKTSCGHTRKGLVCAVDLESYNWKPGTKALIRATEATIAERIPPRMEIRRGAPLELPHIMLLVNDSTHTLVEGTGELAKKTNATPVYFGELMKNGGSISGWAVDTEEQFEYVQKSLEKIAEQNTDNDGSIFLFAVGDGNHSLATAKAVWDEYKTSHPDEKYSPLRYALVEIVNIYDEGLTFEPIHRVIFNTDAEKMMTSLAEQLNGKLTQIETQEKLEECVKTSHSDFGFSFIKDGKNVFYLLSANITGLAVSSFQPVLDEYLKNAPKNHICDEKGCRLVPPQIDYIHGSSEVFRLAKQENTTGILLPPIAKESFFETISSQGSLPRKSFSMGESDEKRFYMECRKLFS